MIVSIMRRQKRQLQKARRQDDNINDKTLTTTYSNDTVSKMQQQNHILSTRIQIIFYLFMISGCMKILLFPSYKSTDYNVHRHWKAITKYIHPMYNWYYDDTFIHTIHTLDYPPSFAIFESILSNLYYPIYTTIYTFFTSNQQQVNCIQLLSDDDIEGNNRILNDMSCIYYMRSTVILSDIILWIGSFVIISSIPATRMSSDNNKAFPSLLLFVFLTFNPGLLWLDHIHFQYNGMLLGILLLSIGCLMHANTKTTPTNNNNNNAREQHFYHIIAAILFTILVTMKHLYVTLGLWYTAYLFRRYCCSSERNSRNKTIIRVHWDRFLILAITTIITFILPFIPFIISLLLQNDNPTTIHNDHSTVITKWLRQVKERLFPFQRGLVHTYWAGNIWAIYIALQKLLIAVSRKFDIALLKHMIQLLPSHDTITPSDCIKLLVLCLVPGSICGAWVAASNRCNKSLLLSLSYTAMVTFLVSYHVHEKAIMTVVFPITIWATIIMIEQKQALHCDRPIESATMSNGSSSSHDTLGVIEDKSEESSTSTKKQHRYIITSKNAGMLLFEFSATALLGLFPLLYQPEESLLKAVSYVAYLSAIDWYKKYLVQKQDLGSIISPERQQERQQVPVVVSGMKSYPIRQFMFLCIITFVIVQLDWMPIQFLYGKYEFIPLAITSLTCSTGFLFQFFKITYYMLRS